MEAEYSVTFEDHRSPNMVLFEVLYLGTDYARALATFDQNRGNLEHHQQVTLTVEA